MGAFCSSVALMLDDGSPAQRDRDYHNIHSVSDGALAWAGGTVHAKPYVRVAQLHEMHIGFDTYGTGHMLIVLHSA